MAVRTADSIADAFFRIWTCREAFMKLTGNGFSMPRDSFCIDGNAAVSGEKIYPIRTYIKRGYYISVCSTSTDRSAPRAYRPENARSVLPSIGGDIYAFRRFKLTSEMHISVNNIRNLYSNDYYEDPRLTPEYDKKTHASPRRSLIFHSRSICTRYRRDRH